MFRIKTRASFLCSVISATLFFFFFFFFFFFLHGPFVHAQGASASNLNLARTYDLNIEGVQDGDLVAIDKETGEYILAQTDLEDRADLLGVVAENVPLIYRLSPEGTPIVRAGEVYMNVTDLGGTVSKGDFISTSNIAGKCKKMTESEESIVGVALDDFLPAGDEPISVNGQEVQLGKVFVSLRLIGGFDEQRQGIRRVASLYLGELGLSALDVFSQQEKAETFIRYILALLIVLLSLFLTFRFLGTNISEGINSLGRNPLASRKIQAMIILNISLIVFINLGSILLALFIVRF